MKRVAVTGLGCTPLRPLAGGDAALDAWRADVEDSPFGTAKGWRRMSWESKLAYYALAQAARTAEDEAPTLPADRIGLVIGSRYGCLSLFEEFHRVLRDEGPRAVSPTVFTTGVLNAPVGHASLGQGLQGPCHTLVGSEAAGLEAIALGWELIQGDAVDRVYAIGVEEAPPILNAALEAGSALPTPRVVTEGAAALVLESTDRPALAIIGAVATGRCGRRHDAVRRHAELIKSVAGAPPPTVAVIPGVQGADGAREHAAVRLALGDSCAIDAEFAAQSYSAGHQSALAALNAVRQIPVTGSSLATAAGGRGTTVAIRFDPVS